MRNEKNVDEIILQKIIDCCESIAGLIKRFGDNYEIFISDFAFQMSCGMCIIQIGELTNRLSEEFKSENPEIAWREIKSLRNIHAHEYEKIDFEEIWQILTKDIPDLKFQLEKILARNE